MTPPDNATWFLPLGGTGEIGMNLNLYGHNGRWLLVDCGITFEHDLGSTTGRPKIQMPDPAFIAARKHLIDGLIITHAHEDHLGAVPYLWPMLDCPVYTTPFTASVLRKKSGWRGSVLPSPLIEVRPSDRLQIGAFDVQWLPITHSTPETCALLIRTAGCSVLHTADWKIDKRPVVGPSWQVSDWAGKEFEGLNAVICDSTNALKAGRSPSEGDVADGLLQTLAPLTGKVVVACFASNVARLQSVLRIAHASGRRAGLLGRSLENMYRCALANDYLHPDFRPISHEHLEYLPEYEVLALATGSQGEVGAALHKLALDTHPHLSLGEGDTVIFSAKTIPGNEVAVARLVENLRARNIAVIHGDNSQRTLHASGHPCQEELIDLYQSLHPDLVIPVHGEAEHMTANAKLAKANGAAAALTGRNGDLFHLAPVPGVKRQWAETGRLEWLEQDHRLISV